MKIELKLPKYKEGQYLLHCGPFALGIAANINYEKAIKIAKQGELKRISQKWLKMKQTNEFWSIDEQIEDLKFSVENFSTHSFKHALNILGLNIVWKGANCSVQELCLTLNSKRCYVIATKAHYLVTKDRMIYDQCGACKFNHSMWSTNEVIVYGCITKLHKR